MNKLSLIITLLFCTVTLTTKALASGNAIDTYLDKASYSDGKFIAETELKPNIIQFSLSHKPHTKECSFTALGIKSNGKRGIVARSWKTDNSKGFYCDIDLGQLAMCSMGDVSPYDVGLNYVQRNIRYITGKGWKISLKSFINHSAALKEKREMRVNCLVK